MNTKFSSISHNLFNEKEVRKIDKDNTFLLSPDMFKIIDFLKEAMHQEIVILQHEIYDNNENIEFVETNMFLFHLITHSDGDKILNININIKCDLNTIAQFGLILSNFFGDIVVGFKFMEPYIVVLNNNENNGHFEFGKKAQEVIDQKMFRDIYLEKMKENYTEQFLNHVNIDEIPAC